MTHTAHSECVNGVEIVAEETPHVICQVVINPKKACRI